MLTANCVYIPPTNRRWQKRMRNISQSVTSCCYPPSKLSRCSLSLSLHRTWNASCFQSARSSSTVCRCHQLLYTVVSQSQQPAPRQTRPPHLMDHLPVCHVYLQCRGISKIKSTIIETNSSEQINKCLYGYKKERKEGRNKADREKKLLL